MAESDDNDDLNIYITNQGDIIEDELITYLEERRVNKKVSLFLKKSLQKIKITIKYFFNIFLYLYTNLSLD
jgi:hypothetical protein